MPCRFSAIIAAAFLMLLPLIIISLMPPIDTPLCCHRLLILRCFSPLSADAAIRHFAPPIALSYFFFVIDYYFFVLSCFAADAASLMPPFRDARYAMMLFFSRADTPLFFFSAADIRCFDVAAMRYFDAIFSASADFRA